MRRRRSGALLGLAVAGAALAPPVPSALAQASTACGAPAPVAALDEMTFDLSSPIGSEARTDAQVPVSISFTNNASLLGRPFDVTGITARIVACDPDLQVLPEPSDHSVSSPDGRTMTLEWTPDAFATNGRYVVEFEASGSRPGPDSQRSRVSAPFSLAVPPQPPAEVAATVDEAGKVVLTWSLAGQEADVGGYLIERAEKGSPDYKILETVNYDVTRFVDAPTAGEWRYRVYALRAGASTDSAPVRSAPSGDATATISAPAAGSTTAPGSAGATADGADSGSAPTTTGGAKSSGPVTAGARSTVDLSKFAASLNGRRSTATPSRPPAAPDPGFSEELPFAPGAPAGGIVEDRGEEQASERGGDDVELGQRLVADDGDRRRSLGFVAGGMLLFVLGMTGLFVKSEVRRVDDLERLDALHPDPVGDDIAATVEQVAQPAPPIPDPVGVIPPRPPAQPVLPAPIVSAIGPRSRLAKGLAERSAAIAELFVSRDAGADADAPDPFTELADDLAEPVVVSAPPARPTVAPIDAPALDVPDPVLPSRSRTSANARRTPTGLPSRSADDRREGGAVVRVGHRGTGQGDRRLPVR